jgi:hypothetical protein
MDDKMIQVGDTVSIASSGVYYTGRQISPLIKSKQWIVSSISGNRAVLGKSVDGYYTLNMAVDTKFLTKTTE